MRRGKPAPLPVRDGLGPARLRLHGGNVLSEFRERFGEDAVAKVLAGEVVDPNGAPVDASTAMPPGSVVYLYRELPAEVPVPFDLPILYRDDNIVVVDKPHFLATMPRGGHVVETALVRLRRELGNSELSPAHRLDRLTAGVLLFTARQEVRGAYQTMFSRGLVTKTYMARSTATPSSAARLSAMRTVDLPTIVRNRIIKKRGTLQARIEPGEANAETLIEAITETDFRLTPRTGRTHQLRLHMSSLGLPIDNDPLYPEPRRVADDDFSVPLRLLAFRLEFDDPITGCRRHFVSQRML